MQVPSRELLIVVLKVIGNSELRLLEREIEDKRNTVEIQYLRNLLLQADCDSKGITQPVSGKLTDGKTEKALIENM